MCGYIIDYDAIQAWVTLGMAIIAAVALLIESSRARFQKGIDLLLKYKDNYDSLVMKEIRKGAAFELRNNNPSRKTEELLGFFETLALLTRKKGIDQIFVWHSFLWPIQNYYQLTKSHIISCQEEDPTTWEDFVWLYNQLCKIELKKRKCNEIDLFVSREEIDNFLDRELNN